ncbi:MAG: glycine betaine ABC transporter substrate-binding protein [Gemmatimonadaceae bacterium]
MTSLVLALLVAAQGATATPRPVVVASKPFGESYLLAEMFAQLLEARGVPVQRRLGLGATEIAFAALRRGDIDVYPEYTGTGLVAILHESPTGGRAAAYREVAAQFRQRWDMRWLPPLGFENTYAIAVRRGSADSLHLATLSDLARAAPQLRAGLSPDFIGRDDGLPGLVRAYGMHFKAVRALLPAVKYQALASGGVDVIDGYSTDGLIARYDLVVLSDDRDFFPPYEAAPLASGQLARRNPAAIAALAELAGRLDATTMRRLNERMEVNGEAAASVAHDELNALGLLSGASATAAPTSAGVSSSFAHYLWSRRTTLAAETRRHLALVVLSLLAAVLIAVPLGLALERVPRAAEGVIRMVGLLQTVPGIALLAFMLPLFGIGVIPALVALTLYSLLPILRNTYTGVRDADPGATGAARSLGMTPRQVLLQVRLPLAAPFIFAGIRTAGVIAVGTATLAAFIGAGGLGDPIVAGLALNDTRMVLSGAIPAALLAILADAILAIVERVAAPKGLG